MKEIRDLPVPAGSQLLVGGAAAHFVDLQHSLETHAPIALAIVIVATLIVLFLMTGSVVLPVKQLVMNALNLSAVFGILVFVFQDGRLEGLLDYRSQGALEQTMPILLFAVVFGLSTDYGVFLLSRIKEAHDSGIERSEAVAVGPGANRPDRDRRGAALRDRDRRLRDLADHLHQGERRRHRTRGADRREPDPGAAGAVADGAARRLELVGAEAAAPPAPAVRAERPGAGAAAPSSPAP